MERRLTRKAMNHWRDWLPVMYADLNQRNQLVTTAARAAKKAAKEIRQLMEAGARLDEAEEVVLPKYILLPPEESDDEEYDEEERTRDEELREIAKAFNH